MRTAAPFQADDLRELDGLLSRATAVIPMCEVRTDSHPLIIGMRHDCDNVIDPAVEMATWEAKRGYRSTYYILHSSPYWQDKKKLRRSLELIASRGHEIGIHNNAIAEAIRTGRDPRAILEDAIAELRSYGYPVTSTVAHGDPACHAYWFVNDELFEECARGSYGAPDRRVGGLALSPVSLAEFGLDFDSNWLRRGDYLSDSGGTWSRQFDTVMFPPEHGQLHMLVHPDWWGEAFENNRVAAATV